MTLAISIGLTGLASEPLYELRIYQPAEGGQAKLLQFMETQGLKLVQKNGLDVVAAFTPTDPKDTRIVTLVRHADRDACDAAYSKMESNPEIQAAFSNAFPSGLPLKSLTRIFLSPTDYSPALAADAKGTDAKPDRVFELRTYIATPNNLEALHARFRDHTMKLFQKHGITNLVYWNIAKGESMTASEVLKGVSPTDRGTADIASDLPATGNTLVYFITHRSEEAAKSSFDSFRQDAVWDKVRTESEKAAGGSLTAGNGVKSWFLKPTNFSPLK
jgi:hypothetical protein